MTFAAAASCLLFKTLNNFLDSATPLWLSCPFAGSTFCQQASKKTGLHLAHGPRQARLPKQCARRCRASTAREKALPEAMLLAGRRPASQPETSQGSERSLNPAGNSNGRNAASPSSATKIQSTYIAPCAFLPALWSSATIANTIPHWLSIFQAKREHRAMKQKKKNSIDLHYIPMRRSSCETDQAFS